MLFNETKLIERIDGYMEAAQAKINQHYAEDLPNLTAPILELSPGRKFHKIWAKDTHDRIFAFIDTTNGDILKPASCKAPAKHARGNVFDEDFGSQHTGVYGPNYLK